MTMDNVEGSSMNEVMDKIDASMASIRRGQIVKGTVITVTDEDVIVNIGYMADGIIPKEELSNEKEINPKEIVQENDEIYVYITKLDDGEGNVLLSKKRADAVKVWDELKEIYDCKKKINVEIKEVVKGGAIAYIKGIRAFIPASHISYSYEKDLNKFVGRTLEVRIIEFDKNNNRVVLSRKEVEKEEVEAKREELWKNIKVGEKRKGTVSRLAKFGAFVDLGGIDGLIHLSEMSWKRVNNPSDVVKVGDSVEVYILDADKEKGKISLSLKDVKENPWSNIEEKYKTGSVVEGTVVRLVDFGAFVELESGVDGLVHISEISEDRISKPSDVLTVGDKVKVKILEIDNKKQKMSLSIKEAIEKPVEDYTPYIDESDEMATIGDLFKDKLKGLKLK